MMAFPRSLFTSLLLAVLILNGCSLQPDASEEVSLEEIGWVVVAAGVQMHRHETSMGELTLIKFLENRDFQMADGVSQTVSDWSDQLFGGDDGIVFNSWFFSEADQATGYYKDDSGAEIGQWNSYDAAVGLDTDGQIILEQTRNVDPTEFQAVGTTFPLLLWDGQAQIVEDSGKIAQRTVLATNAADELILIIAEKREWSLYALAEWLASDKLDLKLQRAVNLDGGSSTGLEITAGDFGYSVSSFRVPYVIYRGF